MKIITFVMSRTMVLSAILTNIAFSITLDEFAEKYVKMISKCLLEMTNTIISLPHL